MGGLPAIVGMLHMDSEGILENAAIALGYLTRDGLAGSSRPSPFPLLDRMVLASTLESRKLSMGCPHHMP